MKAPLGLSQAPTDGSGQVSGGKGHSVFGMYTRHSLHTCIWVAAKHKTTLAGQSVDWIQEDKQTDTPSGGEQKNSPMSIVSWDTADRVTNGRLHC